MPDTGLGHNRPLRETPEELVERLRRDTADLAARTDELLHGDGVRTRGVDGVPEIIPDADTARRVTDFIRQIAEHERALAARQAAEKRPFLDLGNAAFGVFRGWIDDLAAAQRTLKARLLAFQRAQAPVDAGTARPPATTLRSDLGTAATVKRTVAFEVEDLAQVPVHLLMVNPAAVKAHISGRLNKAELPPPIPGLRFAWQDQVAVR